MKVFIDQCSASMVEGQSVPSDVVMVTPTRMMEKIKAQNIFQL